MKKKIPLFFVVVFLNVSPGLAQWVSLDKNSPPDSKPGVQLISDDINGTVIKVDISGFRINEFNADGKIYQSVDLGSLGITSKTGMPEISYIEKILAIPNQGTVSTEVLAIGKTQIIKGINIPPARKSWIEGEPETPYLENDAAYRSENLYPNELVKVEDPMIFRDFRITRVSIFPIRYSPAKQEIEAVSSITVRIKYGGGLGSNPKLTPNKPIAPSFAKLYKSIIFNYNEVLQREYNGREDGYDLMLCIMPDSFATTFQQYADWNHKTGTYIHVTKFSEIGASGTNPTAVKNHILDAYTNWATPPTHVLLVGDAGVAPVKYITLDGWTFTYDDYFVELAGNDFIPEMMIGRFTNQGNSRLNAMISKFIGYEKNPYISDPNWFRKGLVCANNAYQSQIETKRFTAQEMLVNGNFISVDSMYNGNPCPGDVTTIINMINEGRGFLNYRGEGWYYGWETSCFLLFVEYINSLSNGQKLTFVTSIGCGVANFDNGSANNFGEAWLEIGEVSAPRGACAFVGPVSATHTYYNDNIDKGIYIGMFEEGLDSPGEALLRGKFYMYEVFGAADPYVNYHYKIYHVLGDPSIHIWKDTPRNIIVDYTDTIAVGPGQILVTVSDAGNGLPLADAKVCVSGDNVYAIGFTLADGTAILDVNPQTAGELAFTVSGGNVIPFEGTIQVTGVNTFALSVSVNNGWNMVSVPGVNPDGQGINNWWAHLNGTVYKFVPGSGYTGIITTIPGEGYWMKNIGAETYNYPAIQIVPHAPISVAAKWNIFGGYEVTVDATALTTTPIGQIVYPIYKFVPGAGYQPATQIVPGYGYWVKVLTACQINVPSVMSKGNQKIAEYIKDNLPVGKAGWGKITLTDAAGNSYTLYAINGKVDLNKYELPPIPPAGIFDVRFGSGRIAEDLSKGQSIEMSGIEYPVKVKVENTDISLQDLTGKEINTNIKAGEEITITNSNINKIMVSGNLIPDKYSLEQNYPNPFNPSTTIRFSVPKEVPVNLSVYNILGEKVKELKNEVMKPGYYEIEFDATSVASGVYLYRIKAGDFVQTKKMILLR